MHINIFMSKLKQHSVMCKLEPLAFILHFHYNMEHFNPSDGLHI